MKRVAKFALRGLLKPDVQEVLNNVVQIPIILEQGTCISVKLSFKNLEYFILNIWYFNILIASLFAQLRCFIIYFP